MKTVLNELKEWIIENRQEQQGSESGEIAIAEFEYCDFEDTIIKINELILKEKEQIIEAATHGANFDKSPFKNAQDYYDSTFGDKVEEAGI